MNDNSRPNTPLPQSSKTNSEKQQKQRARWCNTNVHAPLTMKITEKQDEKKHKNSSQQGNLTQIGKANDCNLGNQRRHHGTLLGIDQHVRTRVRVSVCVEW